MANSTVAAISALDSSLPFYLREIRRFPMLEPHEEYMLAKRWREHGDRDAAHKLVTSHLRLVAKIAGSYRGYGLPIAEVISEGNLGLMQAVKRFEPERGFRLATYAIWWIKAAIQEYILRSWSLVKLGMNRRLAGDASLNTPIREDGNSSEWQEWLVDDSASQESQLAESEQSENRHKALGQALTVLNDRERRIFEARQLVEEPATLDELAGEFRVSRERIRQIEVRAFEKVRKATRSAVGAMERPVVEKAAAVVSA